jgi:hypothetical protein
MVKILVNGDSLGLPREGLRYEDTYPALLADSLADKDVVVINRCQGCACMTSLDRKDALEFYAPRIAIVQLGIVDCAPRLFREGGIERKVMMLMPGKLRKWYIAFVKKTRSRSSRRAYTDVTRFIQVAENYCRRAESLGCAVIFIPIACASERYLSMNAGVDKAIDRYNAALAEMVERQSAEARLLPAISDEDQANYFIAGDGYHLAAGGGRDVCQKLLDIIRPLLGFD